MYPGLLDDEQLQAAYNQFKVNPIAMDPWRMALYQAGQGIATGEGARLDQVLRGAAQGGVEGYNQGLQNQLMYEQAMQAMQAKEEEERKKRETEEIERKYREALTRQADAQAASTKKAAERPEQELQKYREEVIALFPDPTNQTRQYLLAAGPTEGRKILAKYANQPALNETQRADLLNLINGSTILTDLQKKALRGMTNERGPEGQLSNNYNAVLGEIRQEEAKNASAKPAGPKLSDNERILLQSEGRTPEAEIAFGNEYTVPVKSQTQYNQDGSQTVIPIYKEIPKSIREKYPELTSQADQIRAQAKESTKRPPQAVLEAQGQVDELRKIEATIQAEGADIPLAKFDQISNEILDYVPFGNYAQDEDYRKKLNLQNEWIISILRQESGAAIGQDEYKNYRAIYFPMAGDSEAMRKARAEARKRALEERILISMGLRQNRDPVEAAKDHTRGLGIELPGVEQTSVQNPTVEGGNTPFGPVTIPKGL
jgi:hypothetical protein